MTAARFSSSLGQEYGTAGAAASIASSEASTKIMVSPA
jgi:hypothetical protein